MWCSFSESNRHTADVYFVISSENEAQACATVLILKSRTISTKMTGSGIDLVGYAIASLVLLNQPIEGQAGTMLTCCGTDL